MALGSLTYAIIEAPRAGWTSAQTIGTFALSLMSRLRLGLLTATETARQALTTGLTIALVALGAGLLSFIALAIPVGLLFLAITVWLVRSDVPASWQINWGDGTP